MASLSRIVARGFWTLLGKGGGGRGNRKGRGKECRWTAGKLVGEKEGRVKIGRDPIRK